MPGTLYNCSGTVELQAEPRPQYFLHFAFFPPSVAKCEFYDRRITQIIIIQFHHMILPKNKLKLKATFISFIHYFLPLHPCLNTIMRREIRLCTPSPHSLAYYS